MTSVLDIWHAGLPWHSSSKVKRSMFTVTRETAGMADRGCKADQNWTLQICNSQPKISSQLQWCDLYRGLSWSEKSADNIYHRRTKSKIMRYKHSFQSRNYRHRFICGPGNNLCVEVRQFWQWNDPQYFAPLSYSIHYLELLILSPLTSFITS